jgi:hypothetical protein
MENAVHSMRQRLFLLDDRITSQLETITRKERAQQDLSLDQLEQTTRIDRARPLMTNAIARAMYDVSSRAGSDSPNSELPDGSDGGSVTETGNSADDADEYDDYEAMGGGDPMGGRPNHRPQTTSKVFLCSLCESTHKNEQDYREHMRAHRSLHMEKRRG